jgi:hypothetical protein
MRPTRRSSAGRAYLDLQNLARREGRGTQVLLTMYVVERWLARLSQSTYADQVVLKGGMLLAAFGLRRATADADALMRGIAADEEAVLAAVVEIARHPIPEDGVEFRTETATARTIRDDGLYPGVRVAMVAGIATAAVRFRIDVNIGDPITPAPQTIDLPTLRSTDSPIPILGYPIETVLAEKIATAMSLGPANTRVRDYSDIFSLIRRYDIEHEAARAALLATTKFRGTTIAPLSSAIDDLVEVRQSSYSAYRTNLGPEGMRLPAKFAEVVAAVTTFADPLVEPESAETVWRADQQAWTRPA